MAKGTQICLQFFKTHLYGKGQNLLTLKKLICKLKQPSQIHKNCLDQIQYPMGPNIP